MPIVVRKVSTNSKTYWTDMLNGLNCSLISVSSSGQYLVVKLNNDAVLNLGFDGSQYIRPCNFVYNGSTTTFDNPQFPNIRDSATVTFCYSDTLFYMKIANAVAPYNSNKGFTVLYEIIDDKQFFGFAWDNNDVDLANITLYDHLSAPYIHGAILNYTAPSNSVDYLETDALLNSNNFVYADRNFRACSAVTNNVVITFDGENHYSVGAHSVVLMESE